MHCYRRWKCIRRSSTTVTTSSEPSLSCGSNAGMLQRNHPRLHWMHCVHSMQCIPVSKPIHPAAGARHFTPHHCHARAFLFHSQTYRRSSMGDERLTSLALIHVHAQTTPIEPVEVVDKFALTGTHKLNFLRYVIMFLSRCLFLYIEVFACYEL